MLPVELASWVAPNRIFFMQRLITNFPPRFKISKCHRQARRGAFDLRTNEPHTMMMEKLPQEVLVHILDYIDVVAKI
jgi:hypothetical protein